MLHLAAPTPEGWVERALAHLDEILIDHAHCEKKAASTAVNMVFRYPEHVALLRPLSALAREELEHFELMLDHLESRSIPFVRQKPSAYAGRLMKVVRQPEPVRLLDALLVCALIEARSCERMKLLAAALGDDPARPIYEGLLAAEARHHRFYVEAAEDIFGRQATAERLEEVAAHEAYVIITGYPENRLHG